MENNSKPFFDPYILSNEIQNTNMNNFSPNLNTTPNKQGSLPSLEELKNISSSVPSATKYYEEQYMYFKYLSQVVDYKTRLFEYEKLTNSPSTTQNSRASNQKQ